MSADPFDPINAAARNLFNAGQVEAQANRIRQLEERLETLREAGDALAYCFRHAQLTTPEEVMDALREWQEARNHG